MNPPVDSTRKKESAAGKLPAEKAQIEIPPEKCCSTKMVQSGNQAASELLAIMSHEMRTPINGIVGLSELLADAPNLPSDCLKHVKTISATGEAMLRILNDILDCCRLEADGLEIEKSLFCPRVVLESVHSLLGARAMEKGLKFSLDIDEEVQGPMWNDEGRLRQILLNFAGNAIKFTEKGTVVVGIRLASQSRDKSGAEVEFYVRDTGPGIAPESLKRIFEPFAQADSSICRRYGGTGLGLAISKNLAELMGGRVFVTSELGAGSEFCVRLPAEIPSKSGILAADKLDARFAERHPLKVLVAEDNQVNSDLMKMSLRRLGYGCFVAKNGVEAVELYRTERPDMILMDLQMPLKDGTQAAREIRELESHSGGGGSTFILALSCSVDTRDQMRCLAAGMNAYIKKPIKALLLAQWLEKASEYVRGSSGACVDGQPTAS